MSEVLAKKRRQNGIAGKTALEAYQEFQQHYLPMAEEGSKPRRKSNVIPFRRIAAVAASLVLVFSLSITANAFSFRDVWDAVVTWAQETFSFSMGVEVSEPAPNDKIRYASVEELFTQYKIKPEIYPTWIPCEYTLHEVIVDENPVQESFLIVYTSGTKRLKFSIKTFVDNEPEQIEKSSDFYEEYSSYGVNYYIFTNHEQTRAVWIIDNYECYISGPITIEEMRAIIDSIGKG